jgi:pimeloyl-ACP methyl ester carboxylesterase
MLRLLKWTLGTFLVLLLVLALGLGYFRWQASEHESWPAADVAPAGGRFVKAAGLDIFVQEAGPADGPAVLFVHGTGAWSEAWRAQMTALAKTGVHAIALDLPPFGYSQRPEPPSYDKLSQARRILGVLDALHIQRAILVGHSFGAGPTVEVALAAPERVRGLILVDAALNIGADSKPADTPLWLRPILDTPLLRDSLVATFLTNPTFTKKLLSFFIDDPQRATDQWVNLYQKPLMVRNTTPAVSAWLPELLAPSKPSPSESAASYKKLVLPVFLIWGERDTITPLAQAQFLTKLAPFSELAVVKQAGHIPQIEDAEEFNRLLLAFVARENALP